MIPDKFLLLSLCAFISFVSYSRQGLLVSLVWFGYQGRVQVAGVFLLSA